MYHRKKFHREGYVVSAYFRAKRSAVTTDCFLYNKTDPGGRGRSVSYTHLTHFANPNGLPDPDHYVTARDMSLIARAAYQYPEFRKISSTRAYTIPADNKKEAYSCNNTHGMISNHRGSSHLYEYALGGKTGYTDEAGNTLVTFAEKNGMTLLCVILNSSNPAHYNDTESLFEYCFQNFSIYPVADHVNLTDKSNQAARCV